MLSREIKKQLSLLQREASPRKEWVMETHRVLVGTVRSDMLRFQPRKWAVWREVAGMMISPWKLSPAFSFVLIAVFVFVAGSGMVIHDSIPGDPLFSAKIGFEQARLIFALSEDSKADAHVSNVEKRMRELRKIVASDESALGKEKRVKEVVREVKGEIQPLKQNILRIKNIKTAVNINKTTGYIETLDVVVSDLSKDFENSAELKQDLADLKKMIDKANTDTLVVIASALEHKEAEVSQEAEKVITKSEVQNILEDMLQSTREDAQKLTKEPEVKEADTAPKAQETEKEEKSGESNSEKTQQILDQAQESLKQNNLVDTITNISQAKDLINEAKDQAKKEEAVPIDEQGEKQQQKEDK
jgi:hypothetical protein